MFSYGNVRDVIPENTVDIFDTDEGLCIVSLSEDFEENSAAAETRCQRESLGENLEGINDTTAKDTRSHPIIQPNLLLHEDTIGDGNCTTEIKIERCDGTSSHSDLGSGTAEIHNSKTDPFISSHGSSIKIEDDVVHRNVISSDVLQNSKMNPDTTPSKRKYNTIIGILESTPPPTSPRGDSITFTDNDTSNNFKIRKVTSVVASESNCTFLKINSKEQTTWKCDKTLSSPRINSQTSRGKRYFEVFICSHCEFRCRGHRAIQRHVRDIHSHIYTKESNIESHFTRQVIGENEQVKIRKEGSLSWSCSECKFFSKWKLEMQSHIRSLHGPLIKRYICTLCELQMPLLDNALLHVLKSHRNLRKPAASYVRETGVTIDSLFSETEVGYQCSHCEFDSMDISIISNHVYLHADQTVMYHCNICGYSRDQLSDMMAHHNTCHKKIQKRIEQVLFDPAQHFIMKEWK